MASAGRAEMWCRSIRPWPGCGGSLHSARGNTGSPKASLISFRSSLRLDVVGRTDSETLRGFVERNTTDEARAYIGLDRAYETVNHSAGEYVRGMDSLWATIKRAKKGVYHKLSLKHTRRYMAEFAGKHNFREDDTLAQMASIVAGMLGRRLMCRDLIADHGLPSGARS